MDIRRFVGRIWNASPLSGKRAALVVATLGAASLAGAALADSSSPRGVIELFTSQGCSSCPPADTVLSELVKRGDVVALAYHVDYWDYLGWRDSFGTAENTARQYEYMKSFKAQSVYTPQAVINARRHVNRASRRDIEGALSELKRARRGLNVEVSATYSGSSLLIEADAASGGPHEAEVVVVYFDPPTPVQIERGENTGKTVTYWNAVTGVQVAGMWHGKSVSFELPKREVSKKGAGGCAVLLQSVNADGTPGPILGAAIVGEPKG